MDKPVRPVRVGEQVMSKPGADTKITIGFIEDQRNAVFAGKQVKRLDQAGGIFHARWIVGRNQYNGTGACVDQTACFFRIGIKIASGVQRHCCHACHVEPHFVVEVPRGRKNDLVAFGRQCRCDGGESLIAARCDRNLLGADIAIVHRARLGRQGFAQIRMA